MCLRAYWKHAGSLQELAGLNRTETAGPHPGRLSLAGLSGGRFAGLSQAKCLFTVGRGTHQEGAKGRFLGATRAGPARSGAYDGNRHDVAAGAKAGLDPVPSPETDDRTAQRLCRDRGYDFASASVT